MNFEFVCWSLMWSASVFDLCFCGSRREFDTGMLLLGSEVNFLHVIPPRQRAFTTLGRSAKECTEQVKSEDRHSLSGIDIPRYTDCPMVHLT